MKNKTTHTLSYLCRSVLFAMAGISVSASVIAQEEQEKDEKEIEVIEVKGIRGSVLRSINAKRFSEEIVDTISSEDIGKFPDNNIAESLQRITGVSIERESGEGRKISIRGLGPEFSAVYFNGRQLASEDGERSFNLDTLATDMVREMRVYKSSSAKITEGGLGGTVDIVTARPFNNDGLRASVNVKAIHTETSGETEPQLSALVSNTFADGKFGLLGSVNYYERTQQNNLVTNWKTMHPTDGWGNNGFNVRFPAQIGSQVITDVRERMTYNLVAQYQATEDLTITADYMHNDFTSDAEGWSYRMVLDTPSEILETADNEIDGIPTATKFTREGGGFENNYNTYGRDVDAQMFGLNFDWQLTDSLRMVVDVFDSTAKNDAKDKNQNIILRRWSADPMTMLYDATGGGVPSVTVLDANGQPTLNGLAPSQDNIDEWYMAEFNRSGQYVDAHNTGLKADFTYYTELQYLSQIDFGFQYAKNEKLNENYQVYASNWAEDPSINIENLFADFTAARPEDGRVVIDGLSDLLSVQQMPHQFQGLNSQYLAFDLQQLEEFLQSDRVISQLQSLDALAARPDDPQTANVDESKGVVNSLFERWGYNVHKPGTETYVEEEIKTAYVEATFDFELWQMPIKIYAGGRYTETEVLSRGTFAKLINLTPKPNPQPGEEGFLDPTYANGGDLTTVEHTHSYSNFLPSLNMTVDATDDFIVRFAAYQSLTRPRMGDLNPGVYPSLLREESRTASGGNPFLEPYVADSFDLSLEWYYADDSLMSLAVFTKDIQDWIIGNQPIVSSDYFDLENDQYEEFTISAPDNVEEATLEGLELSIIHTFDIGLGVQANATWIDSDVADDADFAMTGVSDNANLAVFYENDLFETRLAYNWRSDFLIDPNVGGWIGPLHAKDYEQLDFSANFNVTESLNLYIEANNLLNEAWETYSWTNQDFLSHVETGRRYALGLRYSL